MNTVSKNINKKIPVFIHHEIGEKKQAGKDNRQSYLKQCISQAEKFENEIFLFGDNTNESWARNFIDVKDITSEKWDEFTCYFHNYSTYPEAWAKGIFKRFFLFREYVLKNDVKNFFVLDSDVLLYANLSEFSFWDEIDFAAEMPLRQSLKENDELRWTICAGVSYWTQQSICDFIDFCIDTYKNKKNL